MLAASTRIVIGDELVDGGVDLDGNEVIFVYPIVCILAGGKCVVAICTVQGWRKEFAACLSILRNPIVVDVLLKQHFIRVIRSCSLN